MNRRQFLLWQVEGSTRVAELSCERLFMRLVDVDAAGRDDGAAADGDCEPSAQLDPRPSREVFDTLRKELEGANVLRLIEPSWLAHEALRRELEPMLAAFRARGGVVEW
jgi:hypothetical protein